MSSIYCENCGNNKNKRKCKNCLKICEDGYEICKPTCFIEKEKDVYYLVKFKDNIDDNSFYLTTVANKMCGKLVNQVSGHFYFELNDIKKSLVIVPHNWIKWMAPSKKLN